MHGQSSWAKIIDPACDLSKGQARVLEDKWIALQTFSFLIARMDPVGVVS